MLKLIRTNFDRHESRRDRRYALPAITVTIAGTDYAIRDWSLGGFQPVDGPDVAVGSQIAGVMRIADRDEACAFTAEAVRGSNDEESVGFHFVEPSAALVAALDRALIARYVGKRS